LRIFIKSLLIDAAFFQNRLSFCASDAMVSEFFIKFSKIYAKFYENDARILQKVQRFWKNDARKSENF